MHERDIILPLLTVCLSIKLCYRTVSKRIHVSYIFGRYLVPPPLQYSQGTLSSER